MNCTYTQTTVQGKIRTIAYPNYFKHSLILSGLRKSINISQSAVIRFAIIKRELRKHDRIYGMNELRDYILKSSKSNKFDVITPDYSCINDYKMWWPQYYKKNPVSEETRRNVKDERVYFGISKFSQIKYDSEITGRCTAFHMIGGLIKNTFLLTKNTQQTVTLPTNLAYPTGKVPIKASKINDIKELIKYLPQEHLQFYNSIVNWPTDQINIEEENVDAVD